MSLVSGVRYRDSAAPTSITITNLVGILEGVAGLGMYLREGVLGEEVGRSYNIRVIPSRFLLWTFITTI